MSEAVGPLWRESGACQNNGCALYLLHPGGKSVEGSRLWAIRTSPPNEYVVKGKRVKGNEWLQSPPGSPSALEMAIQKDALHRDVKMRAITELHKIVSLEDGSWYCFSTCVLCNWC